MCGGRGEQLHSAPVHFWVALKGKGKRRFSVILAAATHDPKDAFRVGNPFCGETGATKQLDSVRLSLNRKPWRKHKQKCKGLITFWFMHVSKEEGTVSGLINLMFKTNTRQQGQKL